MQESQADLDVKIVRKSWLSLSMMNVVLQDMQQNLNISNEIFDYAFV